MKISDGGQKSFGSDGVPMKFWLHPALQSRQTLTRIIELKGGQVIDDMHLTQVALVPTSTKTSISAALYSNLIDRGNTILDPSWILDSVENGELLTEQDYMGFEPHPDNSHAPVTSNDRGSPEVEDEKDKEAGEFFLEAILRLCRNDNQVSWPEIYAWCAENVSVVSFSHDTRNTVDYWRSLNSPGYEVHAAAVALRQDMKDSSNLKSENDDLNDLVHSARKIYPPRIPLQTQSPPPASDPKPAFKHAQAYSMTEEFAALKDLLQAQKLKADFAPWSYKWWERFERLFPGRSSRELHAHYRNADELRSIGHSLRPQGGSNAVSTPVNRPTSSLNSPNFPLGAFTPEEVAALRGILISERDKTDFDPESVTWWKRFESRIPTRSARGLHKRCFRDPELRRLIAASNRPTFGTGMPMFDDVEGNYDSSESEEEPENPDTKAKAAPFGPKREPRIRYTDKEFETMRAILVAERGNDDFDPLSISWWERFVDQFPQRSASGLFSRYRRTPEMMALGNYEAELQSPTPSEPSRKRRRSQNYFYETCKRRTSSINDNDPDDEESGDLDDKALISQMLSNEGDQDTNLTVWGVEDIERILACVKPGTYEIPPTSFESLSGRYGRTPQSWRMKWVRNRHIFRRILIYRRSLSSALPHEAVATTPEDRSPKRVRTESDGPHPAKALVTQPLSVTPPVDYTADERMALRHAVTWFLESIAKKKPANDGEVLSIWTAISMAKGPSVTSLMKLYYTNLDLFEHLMRKC